MKFQIGETAYLWADNGNGVYDGMKYEIIAFDRRPNGIYYRCDNLSSDLPRFVPETKLVSAWEWQDITERVLNGDLKDSYFARKIASEKRWFIHHERRQYAKGIK